MARRPTAPPVPPAPAKLLQPRNKAREILLSRSEQGAALRDRQITSVDELERAKADAAKWSDYNRELLRRFFTTEEYAQGYNGSGWHGITMATIGGVPFGQKVSEQRDRTDARVQYLDSLAERLDLIDEDHSVSQQAELEAPRVSAKSRPAVSRRVFVVHGRDDEAKAIVARFLEHCGLEPIILHEQADKGRTVIEKFEESAGVAFAVVLLTPDDVGGLKPAPGEEAQLQDRARQNVILELGYFVGALGRSHVLALKRGDVELPSDFAGVIYTSFDASEGWKLKLARELKAAGVEVDMNKVLA